jgi:ABC-2 type transport system permease protein
MNGVGVNGARLNLAGSFSAQSRQQYAAVAAMRWQMLRHSLRTKRGNFELGARVVTTLFFAVIALGASVGLGFGAYSIATEHSLRLLVVLFWPVFLLWQLFPVMASSFQEHVDLGVLLRFPMGFGSYVLVTLVFALLDTSTVMGAICLIGIWTGLVIADPHAVVAVSATLLLFAAFNLLLTRMIFSWIERWLAQRRTREILGVAFFFLILSGQLIGPAMRHFQGHRLAVDQKTLNTVERVQSFLPPGLAAQTIRFAMRGRVAESLLPSGALILYAAASGLLLGFRLHAEYRGENLGEAPAQSARVEKSSAAQARGMLSTGSGFGSGPIGAVIEKELRYLSRSGVMFYSLVAPLVLLLVLGGGRSVSPFSKFALPVGIAYSFLGLTRMIYNSLGPEGAGIQLYFTSPTPLRTIMLAKNVVQLMLFCLELVLVCGIVRYRFGLPDPEMMTATLCWLLFALPLQLAAGNILSITMAYRMTMTRMTREEGAAGNGFISLLIQLVIVGVGAAVYFPLWGRGHVGIAAGVFLLLALISCGVWLRVFSNLDRMAFARRESLIRAVVRSG